ncbi:hypothetical protein DL766_009191 [Monosporascus sp. MC13-8B]|uniref:BD-FAE-like domain-containing protein n=1 Tax=Monosporascus cannonballus TaxID=155416 RepID=A0ABY0H4G9_9PEZI|nr:hypothetical protein DL763_008889 [Monosporascus cannonballus]RYO84257.1 hypothetical protein DL762_005764 [Monosporascus cannonballus]RYP16237.1 hypothetical protein DL766_009191 [Monosporascus sp. MC13-8B]
MDTLPQLGRGIFEVLEPTFAAYEQLLLSRETEIKSTRRETHQYGPDPRQALDIYYPHKAAAAAALSKAAKPVLVFCYGGGFVQGDKTKPGYANGLVFANIGHYFASRHGFTVVVPDYRLMSHGARFPSGGEDVGFVVDWIRTSLAKQEGYGSIDLFLMGNSVGGVHVSTWALYPTFADSVKGVTAASREGPGVLLRGLLLLGVPMHFGGDDNEILRNYFGTGEIRKNCPLGLLESAKQRGGGPDLPGVGVVLLLSELDPEYIFDSAKDFQEVWPEQFGIETQILAGHNHISPQCSLDTGVEREEAWGIRVAEFCQARATG